MMQSPSRQNLWSRCVARTLILTSLGLTGLAHGAEEAPLFLGALEKISEPVQLKIRPNSRAACTLHQRFVSEEEAPSSEVITFETHVRAATIHNYLFKP